MLKFKRKMLAVILAFTIVLSSSVVWSENADAAPDETTAADTEAAAGTDGTEGEASADAAPAEDEERPVTQDEALAAMTEKAKTDALTLYVNEETCIFAVKDNKSGYIWWSTPYDYETDPKAGNVQKNLMASTVTFRALDVETNTLLNTTTLSKEASVNKKSFSVEDIDGGVKFTYIFNGQNLSIPVSIVLDGDKILARVHASEIEENMIDDDALKNYKLVTMNLIQSFGAGRADENGYIFVPDGSGAIINFNNGKTSTQVYRSKVYGEDLAVSKTTMPNKTENTYLPVLGIVKELSDTNVALLGVVTEGDAYAYVNASVNGQATTSINSAWFSFEFRATDTYTMGTKTPLTVFQSGDVRIDDIEVCYHVMSGDELGLAELAETYRDYLVNEKGLKNQAMEDSNALYVTTYGGTVKKQSILGFPVDMQTVATSYKQAQEILERLTALGVDDIKLIYNNFNDTGVRGRVSTGVDYSKKLGGQNDFADLKAYCDNRNYSLYPSVDFMEYNESGNGYSFTLNSAKRITNAYATQTDFELAYGTPDTEVKPHWTILSPYYWPDVFNKLVNSFNAEGINTISLNQATETLYSDFGRRNADGKEHILRADAIKILTEGFQKLNDAGISIIAQECNAYALPYVSAITNIPLYSSNYDLFDYDVPFYQMVVHGVIPYSSKAINASSNAEELLLLSLMTGSGVHYDMMYASPNDFTDCEFDSLFYTNYEGWLERAAEEYKLFNDTISSLSDKSITKYERVSEKAFAVTYSDGTVIGVDIDNYTYTVNGQEYILADSLQKGEGN
ncbi:MAG: hypothetical protein HDT47_05170 [Ruminococcaceae bacterium]|nr:hypothetical protein [Oscillospiraceae bacterium]